MGVPDSDQAFPDTEMAFPDIGEGVPDTLGGRSAGSVVLGPTGA
jgi:hypothetical protein